eukprot:2530555-Pyramimonas_sp.AAC.1
MVCSASSGIILTDARDVHIDARNVHTDVRNVHTDLVTLLRGGQMAATTAPPPRVYGVRRGGRGRTSQGSASNGPSAQRGQTVNQCTTPSSR